MTGQPGVEGSKHQLFWTPGGVRDRQEKETVHSGANSVNMLEPAAAIPFGGQFSH